MNKEILKPLHTALRLISTLSVSGDAVDVVAEAKRNLRIVDAELKKEIEEEEKNA